MIITVVLVCILYILLQNIYSLCIKFEFNEYIRSFVFSYLLLLSICFFMNVQLHIHGVLLTWYGLIPVACICFMGYITTYHTPQLTLWFIYNICKSTFKWTCFILFTTNTFRTLPSILSSYNIILLICVVSILYLGDDIHICKDIPKYICIYDIYPITHLIDTQCSICWETMTCSTASKPSCCKHIFHTTCLRTWIDHSVVPKCPLCRQLI